MWEVWLNSPRNGKSSRKVFPHMAGTCALHIQGPEMAGPQVWRHETLWSLNPRHRASEGPLLSVWTWKWLSITPAAGLKLGAPLQLSQWTKDPPLFCWTTIPNLLVWSRKGRWLSLKFNLTLAHRNPRLLIWFSKLKKYNFLPLQVLGNNYMCYICICSSVVAG